MTHQPRSVSEINSDIRSLLEGKISKLTNFVEDSFNDVFIDAYASVMHDIEVKLLAVQLASWIDFSGDSSLDETDLEALGVDTADLSVSEVNDFMEDVHLDELGKIVGVTRDTGTKATGKVTITTESDTTQVNEGLEVATEPDSDGNFQSFFVDADSDGEISGNASVTPATNSTTIEVDVIAEEVGTEYNVGANSITNLPDPDVGIESVTNNSETTGGVGEQSNESLRSDIKDAIFDTSGGGTVEGIIGAIQNDVSGVSDVSLEEFTSQQPPTVDVIVDGGSDSDVNDAIDDSRPTGIQHNLVRPASLLFGITAELVGTDIDTDFVQSEIDDYLVNLSLDETYSRSQMIHTIHEADADIEDIGSLTTLFVQVVNEEHTYSSGTDKYTLDHEPLGRIQRDQFLYDSGTDKYQLSYPDVLDGSTTVTAIVNGDETDLTDNTDYDLIDDNNSVAGNDTIDFSIGGDSPDDRTAFEVEYDTANPWDISKTRHNQSFDVSGEDTAPKGIALKPDGTKMYIVGDQGDNIEEYDLSTAWDISSATHNQSFDVSGEDTTPTGVAFRVDGTKMYIVGQQNADIEEYDLSTAWDISTASPSADFALTPGIDDSPTGITFRPDGEKAYVTGDQNDNVEEFDLSTAWDISSTSHNQSFDVSGEDTTPTGVDFKPNGVKMYVLGDQNDNVYEYDLSTAWDVSTATHNQTFDVSGEDGTPSGLEFKPDGTKMYITGDQNDNAEEYDLPQAIVKNITGTLSSSSGHTFTHGIDYDLVDDDDDDHYDTIDWSVGADTPDDSTDWTIDYDPQRTVTEDLDADTDEKVVADSSNITTPTFDP